MQPLLLLGLLVPAAAAIGYPMRRRLYAMAGSSFLSPVAAPSDQRTAAAFIYRPAIDPFAVPALGLTGAGATATARVMALGALEESGDSTLVVIPRPDAGALFGLAEDELLDEGGPALFIPGNLDAALAYLETELAVRRDTGGSSARRLLLVADCDTEAGRIDGIRELHPGGFTTLLLGDWPGDTVSVDEDGLVEARPALAGALPERLPAMSRTEARDRLRAAVRGQQSDLPRKLRQKRR